MVLDHYLKVDYHMLDPVTHRVLLNDNERTTKIKPAFVHPSSCTEPH